MIRCECGADRPCLIPNNATPDAWLAWWLAHPARAQVRPLTVEASRKSQRVRPRGAS